MADKIVFLLVDGLVYDAGNEADVVNRAAQNDIGDYTLLERLKEGQLIALSEQKAIVVADWGKQFVRVLFNEDLTDEDQVLLNRTGLRRV